MALRPGGAKQKGANGERELADLLMGWGKEIGVELDLVRNLEQTRGGGHDLCGLEFDYGLAVEVKRVEAMQINQWWKQAVRQGKEAKCRPVLAWRQNRRPWRFRTTAWTYPLEDRELVIDLEAEEFKLWFQAILKNQTTPNS